MKLKSALKSAYALQAFVAMMVSAVALGVSGAAVAQVAVGVRVGVPVYVAPPHPPVVYAAPVYAPHPPVVYAAPARVSHVTLVKAVKPVKAVKAVRRVKPVSHARVRKPVVRHVTSARRPAARVVHAAPPPPPPVAPVVYAAPVYATPVYAQAPVIAIGWQRDGRYWDGRRYWRRDEWHHHHGGR